MKKKGKDNDAQKVPAAQTFGEFAYQVIKEQFQRIVKQENPVLADKEPEHLHQMRVGTRRLRTALHVFDAAVKMPKAARAKRLRDLARVLGAVRDLDVQIASLQQEYYPQLNSKEQKKLNRVIESLHRSRVEVFDRMQSVLTQEPYRQIKSAYKDWLDSPRYNEIAALPLTLLLPDLLSPLLSELLQHPAWLIATDRISEENSETLHDLRKECKHVRYQTEFFTPFYGAEFQDWIKEVKQLQDDLGALQDIQVLQSILQAELGQKTQLPELQTLISRKQTQALMNWDEVRQKYLNEGYRYHLHHMLLQPTTRSSPIHPELMAARMADSN